MANSQEQEVNEKVECQRKANRELMDRSHRQALRNRQILERIIASIDAKLPKKLDFAKATLGRTEYSGPRWKQKRFMDRLWTIPWREPGKPAFQIAILIEQQSVPELLMALRILIYMIRFWEQQWTDWRHHPKPKPRLWLRSFLPIVISTSDRKWKSPKDFKSLFIPNQFLARFVPKFNTIYWELKQHGIEDLLASDNEWLNAMAVARAASRTKSETFIHVFKNALAKVVHSPNLNEEAQFDLLELMASVTAIKRSKADNDACEALIDAAIATREDLKSMIKKQKGYLAQMVGDSFDEGVRVERLQLSREWLKFTLANKFPSDPRLGQVFLAVDQCQDPDKLKSVGMNSVKLTSLDQFSLN